MLKYNKSGLIATSHVHIHDTENIILACNIFKVIIEPVYEKTNNLHMRKQRCRSAVQ